MPSLRWKHAVPMPYGKDQMTLTLEGAHKKCSVSSCLLFFFHPSFSISVLLAFPYPLPSQCFVLAKGGAGPSFLDIVVNGNGSAFINTFRMSGGQRRVVP